MSNTVLNFSDFLSDRYMTLFTSAGMISGELSSTETIDGQIYFILKNAKVYSIPISKDNFIYLPELLVNQRNIVAISPGAVE